MIKKMIRGLVRLYKIYILKDKFSLAHVRWVRNNGDKTLRLNYDLDENSIVFDLGGYHGDFGNEIYNKYKSKVYIFEPVEDYYKIIKEKFKNNRSIEVFHYGLSDKDGSFEIFVSESLSSIYNNVGKKENIHLKSITSFINENNITHIDLIKINIEGGEFDVLPELIKTNFINKITDLQVQFHTFADNAINRREEIRGLLSKTHSPTYDYWFIWENWKNNIEK
jgi:FkbM family methyltransferase